MLAVGSSILRTLVVPRGVRSKLSGARAAGRRSAVVPRSWPGAPRPTRARDAVLAYAAPRVADPHADDLARPAVRRASRSCCSRSRRWTGRQSFREAGSSLFTLGFASTDRGQLTAVDFLAAATGPVVVGLLVGYLPSLYASYNRREVDGRPAALARRRAQLGAGDRRPARDRELGRASSSTLWRDWERWAADVAESHVNYPVLIHVRSAQPTAQLARRARSP